MTGRLVCAAVAVMVTSAGGGRPLAQQPAQPPPPFRSAVDIVRVEASVLDRDRRPVRGLDETSSYYILGFTPAPPGHRDAAREIQIRVRPGLTVKARNRYDPVEQPAAASRHEDALSRAVTRVLPARDVPLELSAVPMIAGSKGAVVLVGRLAAGVTRPTALLGAAFRPRAAPVTSRRTLYRGC